MDEKSFREHRMREFPILRYFEYSHLPEHLQRISKPFASLAWDILAIPSVQGAEAAAGLRKLLEAKDCLVRAALPPR